MNPILQHKITELENAQDYECWYLVKQPTAFDSLCYLVSFLKDYQENEDVNSNLQDYIGERVEDLKQSNAGIEISNNYRALRVAAFFGLIKMTSTKYDESIVTPTYKEIYDLCDGEFEKVHLYERVIQRQIEKMFISSSVDEEHQGVRQDYRLYPVMLLYKVLLEIGRSTGDYSISMTEYRYLVATTKRFEDFLETLLLIKVLRFQSDVSSQFDQFRAKFDNRLIQALKQLPTLVIERDSISLNRDLLKDVAHKIFIFEESPSIFSTENYLDFLGSTKSLFDLKKDIVTEKEGQENHIFRDDATKRVKGGTNTLLYGVPGSGKSYKIETEYCNDFELMERVVFHPDYMNTDFVGQILPTVKGQGEEKEITYDFTPGPFTRVLKKAFENPSKHFYLVIEEINRGNAPAIFGEVFQLLDREEDGTSSYKITNYNIANAVFNNKELPIYIPSNLNFLATMNTADQNVFTLDTAFQRRWNMKMIENDVEKARHAKENILDSSVTWERFNIVINDQIITTSSTTLSSEDKRLGAYFVTSEVLRFFSLQDDAARLAEEYNVDINDTDKLETMITDLNCRFGDKILKYLWDDAFKFNRDHVFELEYKSLEKVLEAFNGFAGDERFKVFNSDIRDNLFFDLGGEMSDEK